MSELLYEDFSSPELDSRLQWFCAPQHWRILADASALEIRTDAATDFWQRTHYGFQADNGHFLYATVPGDCTVETHVRFAGKHQYDQAGLMVRFGPDCWLKTSVEYEPEEPNRLGAVVTRNGYSDWSTQDVHGELDAIGLRVVREGYTWMVYAAIGDRWSQLRVAHLEGEGPAQVGLYTCSPKGAGFAPRFDFLRISA
jgi:regulation of enolase protein 1 (concanavalin A-like superfamily)